MRTMRKIYTTILLSICFFVLSKAQTGDHYTPASSKPINLSSFTTAFDQKLENDLASLSSKSKLEKQIAEIYTERTKDVKNRLENKHFLFDETANHYLDQILQEIYHKNLSIPKDQIRLFVGRYIEPNAFSVGEGSIVINIGLISELENESQLAFIICHELAHYILNHSNESIKKQITLLEDEAMNAKLKKITKKKYDAVSQTMEILQNIVYQHHSHSRENEKAADSLALVYLTNTSYDATEALKTLGILDVINIEKYNDSLDLKNIFTLPNQAFKEEWLQQNASLSFTNKGDTWNQDSLKTHPDCPERINLLKNYLNNYNNNDKQKNRQPEAQFRRMTNMAKYEEIESALFFKDYGSCLYFAAARLNDNNKDSYVNASLGKCFQLIKEARVTHELGKYAELPADYHPETYRQLLTFLQNLRLKEITVFSTYFTEKAQN